MEDFRSHLKDISAIKGMMEQQSKFLSLSGLSGIGVGICALVSVAWVEFHYGKPVPFGLEWSVYWLLLAALVLSVSLAVSVLFSVRMARKKGWKVWAPAGWRMLFHLGVPLMAGGAFALIQFCQEKYEWIPATTLMFYGLALLNASKFTVKEIKVLGILEVALGLACAQWFEFSIWFWGMGFGVLHILYGAVIYWKYER